MAKAAGVPYKIFPTVLPVTDANSQLTSMIQAAGDGGGDHPRLHARHGARVPAGGDRPGRRRQGDVGLVDADRQHGHGGAVRAVRREDLHQPGVRELDSTGPDETLYSQINAKYTPKIAIQAFGQMGYMDAKFATHALLSIKGAITAKSYNAAVKALVNQKTDMLCKPFYVGNIPYHIPNNADITVTYKGGKVSQVQGCKALPTNIDPADRPDSGLGEEVQADRLAEGDGRDQTERRDQGVRGERCIASSASRCSGWSGSCSSPTSCSASRSGGPMPSPGSASWCCTRPREC